MESHNNTTNEEDSEPPKKKLKTDDETMNKPEYSSFAQKMMVLSTIDTLYLLKGSNGF